MREIVKPDFQGVEGGWIDPDFFPSSFRRELLLHLGKSPLSTEQKTNLISFAADMAQSIFDGRLAPHKQVVDELSVVESDARRLLASLNKLSPQAVEAMHINSSALPHGGYRELPVAEQVRKGIQEHQSLLSSAWDWIAALELLANKSVSQLPMNRQIKPEQDRASGYVSLLARHIEGLSGHFPPKDRSTWFAAFVGALGTFLGYEIGPRIISSGIEQVEPPTR